MTHPVTQAAIFRRQLPTCAAAVDSPAVSAFTSPFGGDRPTASALPQPRVHARCVETVLAARQPLAPVVGLERLQAYRAVPCHASGVLCSGGLVVVARQRVELTVRQAGATSGAAAVLRALLVGGAGRAEPPSQGPEDNKDVDKQHHRDAGDEEDCRDNVAGGRGGHAIFYSRLRGEAALLPSGQAGFFHVAMDNGADDVFLLLPPLCFGYGERMERMLCSCSFRLSALDIERYQDVCLKCIR
jgi:hypothetical protein